MRTEFTHIYDPRYVEPLTFHNVTSTFRDGSNTPRAYLERCLQTISEREPIVRAFVVLNETGAREAADASTARWNAGNPLSNIDGMPVAIKDLLETKDMPTQMGCQAFRDNFPKRDNAAVWALRQAGAVLLGKTVTTELGGSHPGPTTNPWDPRRTPGGSSSGSAAAVAARMIPAALGTQIGGSIIRPAAYCGNVALKPTQGGINRGERQTTSMSTTGVHAGCIEDMWQVAIEIARRCGGDPGHVGLVGPGTPPDPVKPDRFIVLETEGWPDLDDASKSAFEGLFENVQRAGVTLLRRRDHPWIEKLEQAVANGRTMCNAIINWENRWVYRNIVDRYPDGVSFRLKAMLAKAESMTPDDYRCVLMQRSAAQQSHATIAPLADGVISLSCAGPAPLLTTDVPDQATVLYPTGDFVFNAPSSILFAPAVTVPMMSVRGLPVGAQLMGQQNEDVRITAFARWMQQTIVPVVTS